MKEIKEINLKITIKIPKNQKPNDQKDEQEKGGGLSKQQMENLLEAINNIENDVNKKVNANKKKVQTSKKSEKDW